MLYPPFKKTYLANMVEYICKYWHQSQATSAPLHPATIKLLEKRNG